MAIIKKIEPFFVDKRGEMAYLIGTDNLTKIKSILFITCKKGAVRANHYHKTGSHFSFLIKGKMEYFSKDQNSGPKIKPLLVSEGEMVYTPPMEIHAMKFLEDSIFIALTSESRNHTDYEKDTVRIKLI